MIKHFLLIFGIFLLILSSCQKYEPVTNPSDIYGTWGGEGLVMVIGPEGATLEYDCATGTINEPILPDAKGMFQVTGTHKALSMPVGMPDAPPANIQPAHISGTIEGQTMVVTVTLDVSETVLGTYRLTFGDPGTLFRCL
ncbi:MAG TPA: hypothetical protein VIS72_15075 [Anaerolineales bacterium]